MSIDYTRIVDGMEVVGPAGETIGSVKGVRVHDFLLDRTMQRDLYVPFSAVREVGGRTIVLGVTRDEVGSQEWEMAPLFGGPTESDSTAPPEDKVVGTGDPEERGTWSASSDSYDLGPLDTRAGQLATAGIDDGESPRASELPHTASQSGTMSSVAKTDK